MIHPPVIETESAQGHKEAKKPHGKDQLQSPHRGIGLKEKEQAGEKKERAGQ